MNINNFTTKIIDTKIGNKTITQEYLIDLFKKQGIFNHIDSIEYNSLTKELTITKNPFGFKKNDINDANDSTIVYSSDGISSDDFATKIKTILKEDKILSLEKIYKLIVDAKNKKQEYIDNIVEYFKIIKDVCI